MVKKADEILLHSVKGITDLIIMPGLVNLDFADVRTTMSKAGMAIMGIGIGQGENRAIEAAERAISHPLLEDISIAGAKGVLINITSASDLTMEEMTEASERIYNEVGDEAEIIWGTVIEDSLESELRVTVIATGIGSEATPAKIEPLGENPLRGRIRDISPSDVNSAIDLDEPTYMRRLRATEESSSAHYQGFKGIVLDSDDLDTPTFLRRKAD